MSHTIYRVWYKTKKKFLYGSSGKDYWTRKSNAINRVEDEMSKTWSGRKNLTEFEIIEYEVAETEKGRVCAEVEINEKNRKIREDYQRTMEKKKC